MRTGREIAAFTLIEALAVAVIVALGAAVVAASLRGGITGSVTAQDALWSVGAADRRARVEALGHGLVTLEATERDLVVSVEGDSKVLHREELWEWAHVRIRVEGNETGVVRFDRAGRSADYEVEFGRGDKVIRARVSGTTGWIVMERGVEG